MRLRIESRTANPWGLFTATGDSITTLAAALAAPTVLVYEGGSFIWPGVRVGHRQPVPMVGVNGKRGSVEMETLSLQPLVFAIDDFLSLDECAYIRAYPEPRVAQSGVSLMDKDKGKEATEWRTSSTYFMPSKGHAPLQAIDDRVSQLTRVPTSHQE